MVFFSSRRRHTRYWRDWSSDVCSSDLEDVVRADVQEIIASLLTDLGQVPWTECVDPVSKVGLCLATVDVGVGSRVHDDIWGVLLQRQPHGTEVRNVKLSLRERDDLVAVPGEEFGELEAELATRAAYEDLQHVVLPRPLPAVHRTGPRARPRSPGRS